MQPLSDLETFQILKDKYAQTVSDIVPLIPTLLAVLDFRKTMDIRETQLRMSQGYYGVVESGEFHAPKIGPYRGFLSDISLDDVTKMRELVYPEKNQG